MVHCDPAPPHPDPGVVSGAPCFTWPDAAILLILAAAILLIPYLWSGQLFDDDRGQAAGPLPGMGFLISLLVAFYVGLHIVGVL